jgi:DNA-binding XRE family transcriptional regulator
VVVVELSIKEKEIKNMVLEKLKDARIEAGKTQMELARDVGVSVNTIIKWENGVSTPSDENYQKLIDALESLPLAKIG